MRAASGDVLGSLQSVCGEHGLDALRTRLASLESVLAWDMKSIAKGLADLPRGDARVQRAAHHLLDQGGKRLRPMCVALASHVGSGLDARGAQLAIAVELVHAATLLHDDVVDLGDTRRGAPAARTVYGNAASIFAGDWLLIDALRRVREARIADTLERLLDVIEEMIFAESLQLERRGHVDTSVEDYFRIVEGKTAVLFQWACFAGGRAGGLDDAACAHLEAFGRHLGVAFQLVDDLLDYDGESEQTGKSLFTDLREGKLTHPLLVARDADPSVRADLTMLLDGGNRELERRIVTGVRRHLNVTRDRATRSVAEAFAHLETLPEGPAKEGMRTVALAVVERRQ